MVRKKVNSSVKRYIILSVNLKILFIWHSLIDEDGNLKKKIPPEQTTSQISFARSDSDNSQRIL